MDKKLQDLVWSILPKKFKEEVKRQYRKQYTCESLALLITIFGHHNLTSDAEGEEMLTVPRKKVEEKWQRAYEQEAKYSRAQDSPVAREELYYNRGILSILDTLFGSKCLPDEAANEDNFASKEPKFKVGDVVRRTSDKTIHKIIFIDNKPTALPYQFENGTWSSEDYLEPYTGPE